MRKEVKKADAPDEVKLLSTFMEQTSLQLMAANGADLIQQIGVDVIRSIILDILVGKNLRDSTEKLTRRRIAALNLAMASLFIKGTFTSPDFGNQLPYIASSLLARRSLPKGERWIAQWMLGLTDKAVQNVLRDNKTLLDTYRNDYMQTCKEIIDRHRQAYGDLSGKITLDDGTEISIDWLWLTYLLNAVGSQTLTIRGSEKSTFGKLFEKLVLGSLLSILGFRFVPHERAGEKVFWLSSQHEKRESDATLLYEIGKGVRFDIGFIGRGNPEISLDKVTRFQQAEVIRGIPFYMATIIIVDRVGRDSRILDMARAVNGTIVQMSATYWPKQVAELLRDTFGYEHPLIGMSEVSIEEYLQEKLKTVPIQNFVRNFRLNGTSDETISAINEQDA